MAMSQPYPTRRVLLRQRVGCACAGWDAWRFDSELRPSLSWVWPCRWMHPPGNELLSGTGAGCVLVGVTHGHITPVTHGSVIRVTLFAPAGRHDGTNTLSQHFSLMH